MATIEFDNEISGIFDWDWSIKVKLNASKFLLPRQAASLNDRLVKNIHTRYISLLSSGYSPVDFINESPNIANRIWNRNSYLIINAIRDSLNVDIAYIDSVLRSVYELASKGEISLSKLDPQLVLGDKIKTEQFKQNSFNRILSTVGAILGVALGGYILISKGK